MINGTDQLGILNQHIDSSRNSLDALHRSKEDANRQLVQTRNQMTKEYRNLARFRLDEMTANRMAAQLDETDRAVLKLVERRTQAMAQLDPEIERSTDLQSSLNAQREQAIQRRDDLVKEIDERAADIQSQLSQQEDYQSLEEHAVEETTRAEHAKRKATQAETDQDEKGKSYRNDDLFMYLWNRHFLTPDYTGSGLVRRLDGWVANIIHYTEARSNYYMLTELPVRLRKHAERQKEIAGQAADKLQAMEEEALNIDEILQRKRLLQDTNKTLESIESQIEGEEERYDTFLKQRSQFSSGTDDISRQAIELQVSGLRDDSLADLYRKAKRTPKPDDDVIVGRIRNLQQEEKRLEKEIDLFHSQEQKQQQSYRELEELRRRYRRSGYDSRHSQFPGGFELGALLAMLMSGQKSGRDVWGQIDREQQFKKPRTPRGFGGGMFSGGFGGGMGGGGFGSGGGFGGGGFRTGGGF